jgi:hypothetical protein
MYQGQRVNVRVYLADGTPGDRARLGRSAREALDGQRRTDRMSLIGRQTPIWTGPLVGRPSLRFRPGALVLVDGRDKASVRAAWPEGSTSYAFPHYTVDILDGDQNVAVAAKRLEPRPTERKTRSPRSRVKLGSAPLSPTRIAYDAGGREAILMDLLRGAGARILRTREAYNRDERANTQFHVRFPDGTMGFFAPGGPPHMTTYSWHEGSAPGDAEIKGRLP